MKLSELIVQELNKAAEQAGKEPDWKLVESEKLVMHEDETHWRKLNGQFGKE